MKTTKRERFGGRGDGYLFMRSGSPYWYSALFVNGEESVESTKTPDLKLAKRVHRQRLDEKSVARQGGKPFVGPKQKRIKIDVLLDDLKTHYRIGKAKSLGSIVSHLKHVETYFKGWRAINITKSAVGKFIAKRQDEGASASSINGEVCYLGLALKRSELSSVPKFERLQLRNVRTGFFERPEVEAVIAALPEYLRDLTRFACSCGWRRGECLSLRWSDVDLAGGEIRLSPEHSKTGQGRVLVIEEAIAEIIERRKKERRLDCVYVFHHGGRQIKDFRHAWLSACEKAHVEGRLFHDLRRTAVRDMVRAGVPEHVAMSVSGHESRSVFDRYDIVSTDDQRDAMKKMSRYTSAQPTERRNVRALRP